MKRLGPELKMPELKAPTFLVDLWWDLWDRRLLPLVALVAVAIVAVPFLIGRSKEVPQSSLAALAAAGAAPTPASSGSAKLAVVQAEPGLRNYRKRLSHLSPTDPFKQRFTAPVLTAHLKSESSTGSTTTKTGGSGGGSTETSGGETTSGTPSAPTGAPTGAPPKGKLHIYFFAYAIDLKITREKKEPAPGEKPESWERKRVLAPTLLPGKNQPAVTYMGVSKDRKPLFLVSRNVESASGEGKCISGETEAATCQLLEIEPGFPETFVYGPEEVRYTIKVLSVKFIMTHHT